MDIEALQAEHSASIDAMMASVFEGNMPNLHDAIQYHLGTGGKKVRPLLAIVTYQSLAKGSVAKIMPFAAACEMLHSWILVHDDIEDGDRMRRDMPTVWVKYGVPHAINIGDYMAHKVFDLILKSRDAGVDDEKTFLLVKVMNDTALRTAEGQTMEMNLRANDEPAEKQYLDMIIGKTAHYLTVPMVGAAVVADRRDLVPKLIEFGRDLGPAFQIADDLLDLTEGKGRKEIGRDIKEGKRSLLVVHCAQRCSAKERAKLFEILNKPSESTSDDDVLFVKALMEKNGSIDYAKKRAEEFTQSAKRVAESIPELRDVLHFFADYAVKRRK